MGGNEEWCGIAAPRSPVSSIIFAVARTWRKRAWQRRELGRDGCVRSRSMPPGMPAGREGAKAAHQMSMASFPDRRMTIEDVVGDGDRVAVRTTMRGTNTGGVPWLSVPANGRRVEIESISIYRVANDRVIEHWGQNDVGRLMMQLGAASPTPTAPA